MLIRELSLINFRNYVRLALQPAEGVTVLRGDNGQGKSNVLEAVYVLATTRSLRAGSDRELVHWRARRDTIPFARLEASVVRADLDLHVEILIRAEADATDASRSVAGTPTANGTVPDMSPVLKKIKVNGLPTRAVDLVGQVNVVLFTPDDVGLVAGPPVDRRRYLDITNSQVSGVYLRTLQRYNRVLVQRNHLLRQIRERRQRPEQLDFWNDELTAAGAQIVADRLKMVAAINRELDDVYRRLSGSEQALTIAYRPSSHGRIEAAATAACEPSEPPAIAELYRARIEQVRGKEIEQGVSLVGPHRDDFSFLVDGVDLNTYGSRGQQRLAVLALKLAEGQYMRSQTGERPILLLDDVLSELDPARRSFVLSQAGREGQTIITATDFNDFSPAFLADAAVFQIDRGTATPVEPAAAPTI